MSECWRRHERYGAVPHSAPLAGLNQLYTSEVQNSPDAYPPDPCDLRLSPPDIRLPVGSYVSPSLGEKRNFDHHSCTLNAIPSTPSLLQETRTPLGLVLSPYRKPKDGEEPVPTVQDGVITRCQSCRAYINPYVQFIDRGNRWRCALCAASNDVPQLFDWNTVTNQPSDRLDRHELTSSAVDFIATTEYVRDAPQALVYVFLIDVSYGAIKSGMVSTAVDAILQNLDRIPNTKQLTKVAIVCYDISLYFFSMPSQSTSFDMLVVSDLEDISLPRPKDLLVDLLSARQSLEAVLLRIPQIFSDIRTPESATGPALEGAFAILAPIGGKIILLSASLPTVGKGALEIKGQSVKEKGTDPDKTASDFYNTFVLSCIKRCISVDIFVFGNGYRGLATLTLLPHYTSGQAFCYPDFNSAQPEDALKFLTEFSELLAMPILLEAEMRIRCSRGISVKSMHGNFFVQGTDRAVMPTVPMDQSYAFELQIDEPLTSPLAVFQSALLHTTSSGERRIRVLTLALPTTSLISDVFASADPTSIVTLLAKRAVQRPSALSIEDKRDQLFGAVADICNAYRASSAHSPRTSELPLPAHLKMLPILVLGIFKKVAVRVNREIALDISAYSRFLLSSFTPSQLITYLYPNVYSLHNMPPEAGCINEQGVLVMPRPLPLTSSWWEAHGLYLISDGQSVYLWVGRDAVPQLIADVFGVGNYATLVGGKAALPEVDTPISQRIRPIIGKIREQAGVYRPSVFIVKDGADGDPGLRLATVDMLIQDRADELRIMTIGSVGKSNVNSYVRNIQGLAINEKVSIPVNILMLRARHTAPIFLTRVALSYYFASLMCS
ncbi:hypothetical protein B0H10DRAFT_2169644 [Mycena sp. CBHHK59/15]|nr:hypothetical protein B0H10DRAFT_2169644 [Mycena sp. CBHHK59/15]